MTAVVMDARAYTCASHRRTPTLMLSTISKGVDAVGFTVHHGSGSLLVFTNQTGETITDVHMQLRGKAVGGRFARRDWSLNVEQWADGQTAEAPFRAAFGAHSDPPRIEITWTAANGQPRYQTLDDLPL